MNNKDILIALLLVHKDELVTTIKRRQETSTSNKDLHQDVLGAIETGEVQPLYPTLFDHWYMRKPLEGVIYCMNIAIEDKCRIIETYDKVLEEKRND